jgi:hypothetical protein
MENKASKGMGRAAAVLAALAAFGTAVIPGLAPVATAQTVGTLFHNPEAFSGAVLFAPTSSDTTYLINPCGEVLNRWTSEFNPGMSVYLTPEGDLVRAQRLQSAFFAGGGIGGGFERRDWAGNLLWSGTYANDTLHAHHDFVWMPNGHLLIVAWEAHDGAEAIARGRLPELTPPVVWSERVVELAPIAGGGMEEVWVWRAWDHLVQDTDPGLPGYGAPADFPGRFDVNFEAVASGGGMGPGGGELAAADWMHVNSIDYHPGLDQVVLGSRYWNEVWVIDHSTTTAEAAGTVGGAAGRGGEVLYRFGNPAAYGRGTEADQRFFGQHDVQWVPEGLPGAGDLMVYNNGFQRPEGMYSTVEQWTPPLLPDGTYALEAGAAYGPVSMTWVHGGPGEGAFYSPNVSGTQRLPDGATLYAVGASGRLYAVDAAGNLLWHYVNPTGGLGAVPQGSQPISNGVFRAQFYSWDFPGFVGRDLTPGAPIEPGATALPCPPLVGVADPQGTPSLAVALFPNPATTLLERSPVAGEPVLRWTATDLTGRHIAEGLWWENTALDVTGWPRGAVVVHIFGLQTPAIPVVVRMLLL